MSLPLLPCAIKQYFHGKVQFIRIVRQMGKSRIATPAILGQFHPRPYTNGGDFLLMQGKHVLHWVSFRQCHRLLPGKGDGCRIGFFIKGNAGVLCIPYDRLICFNGCRKGCHHRAQGMFRRLCTVGCIVRQQQKTLGKGTPRTGDAFAQCLLQKPLESAGCRCLLLISQHDFRLLRLSCCDGFFPSSLHQVTDSRQTWMLLAPSLHAFPKLLLPQRRMTLQKLNFLRQGCQCFFFPRCMDGTQPLLMILPCERGSLPCIYPAHLHRFFLNGIMDAEAVEKHSIFPQVQFFLLRRKSLKVLFSVKAADAFQANQQCILRSAASFLLHHPIHCLKLPKKRPEGFGLLPILQRLNDLFQPFFCQAAFPIMHVQAGIFLPHDAPHGCRPRLLCRQWKRHRHHPFGSQSHRNDLLPMMQAKHTQAFLSSCILCCTEHSGSQRTVCPKVMEAQRIRCFPAIPQQKKAYEPAPCPHFRDICFFPQLSQQPLFPGEKICSADDFLFRFLYLAWDKAFPLA